MWHPWQAFTIPNTRFTQSPVAHALGVDKRACEVQCCCDKADRVPLARFRLDLNLFADCALIAARGPLGVLDARAAHRCEQGCCSLCTCHRLTPPARTRHPSRPSWRARVTPTMACGVPHAVLRSCSSLVLVLVCSCLTCTCAHSTLRCALTVPTCPVLIIQHSCTIYSRALLHTVLYLFVLYCFTEYCFIMHCFILY